jgi:formylglycine-generating enzyme required for sulfatase activity
MSNNLFSKLLRSFFHNPFHRLLNQPLKAKKSRRRVGKNMQVENLEPRLVPSVTAPENPYQQQVKQIVFVDSSIPNRESLFDATMLQNSTTEVVQLNALQNGLEQIANALAAKTNLEAIHVFSHGQQGKIVLGNTTVGTNEINSNLDYLSTIGKSLTADGDLLLYGCYVADGFVGQDFVNRLAEVTGADVAASDDATGDVVTGGNWNLEQTTGPVETTSLPGDIGNNLLNNYTISIGQNSPRLYWQGRDTGSARYAQPFTDDQYVAYFAQVWKTKTWEYSVPTGWFLGFPTKWEKRTGTSSWQENEYRLYNYGAGTRYGTANITLTAGTAGASTYQFYITPNSLIKNWLGQGQDQGSLSFRYNLALYKDSFNPNDPMRNLVGGGLTSISWVGNTDLLEWDRYSAGNYIAVLSYDDYITQDHYNAFWGSLNRHAEQLWGSFTIQVQNMNQAPVWGTVSNQSVTGSGSKSFSVPWSAVSDPDGNPLSVSATLSSGAALPSWLSFNANSLTFTGNPPPNTTPITIRLTASDGQATATRDFTVTFSADNDRPTVAIAIPTQTWDGSGAFSYQVPSGTFADSDPSGTSFTYTASLADGSALPAWLSFNTTTRTFSGNPPANASDLTLRVIADDGSGQANATVNADFTLRLLNNNDIPSLTGFNKTLNEDSTVSFSAGDFSAGFTDTDSRAVGGSATTGQGKSLDRVRILSLPANGTLWLDADNDGVIDNGEAIAVNQEIVNGDLGKLRFTPNADWTGVTSFSWNATDGVAYATNAATAALTVQLVDDAPRLTMSAGRTLTLRPNTGNALSTPVLVDSGLTLIDVDAAYTSDINFDTIYGATVTVVDSSSGNFQSGDVLAATGISGKITVSYNSASGALSLSGEARAAEYQQVLRTLAFSSTNTSNDNLRQVNISLRTKNVTASVVANFDGVDDYIETLRASIPMGGDWTVSVWARADNSILGSTGEHTILAQGTSSENFYLQRASASNNLRLGDNWTYSGGMPTDGQWHQYTVVRSGSGATDGTLYIDGIKVSTGNLPDVLPGTGLRIGQLYKRDNTQEWGGFWKGSVSDLRVYNRALNALEVSASLNEATPPSGYEANLVSWFPLNGSADNKAVSSWNLGRDFDPRSPQWRQGPWDLGYLDIGRAQSDFPASPPSGNAFLSFDRTGSTPTLTLPGGNGNVVRAYSGVQNNGYIEFMPNTAESITGNNYRQRPGELMMLPNDYPTAAQFTAPISGVFGVDARFWRTFTNAGNPKYKIYKLSGSTMSEVDAGSQIGGGDPSSGTVSGLKQIVLEQGEKLIFAVHPNGTYADYDESSLSLQVDLLATKVISGGATYYYSHANGHYYGLPSGSLAWDAAKTAAEGLNVAGKSGYLATPTDSASMQIVRAILTDAGIGNAWAGARQINSNNEPAGNFYWATGPKAGQPFNGSWNDGEPNNYNSVEHYVDLTPNKYNDNNGANALRYVVEFGDAKLALPTQLTDNISGNSAPGNALIFQQADVAYSARTGHYYKVDSTGRTWDDAASNAAAIGNMFAGQRGYLARITDLNELRIAGWFNRLRNQADQWVGLRQTNTSVEPSGGWQWTTGDEAGMTSDINFTTPTFWSPGEPNNDQGGTENHGGMNNFGFALNDYRNTQTLGSLIEYGIDGQVLTIPLFGLPPAQSSALNVVTIGDAGNSADSGTGNLYGDVGYAYQIGKYEITIAEYTAFLNAVAKSDPNGLWNPSMATDLNVAGISRSGSSGSYSYSVIGSGNRPITYVSWFDAARYANWVHNGKPSGPQNAGTTEDGAYTLTSGIGDGGWNLGSDFSTTNNPNGAWTYGYQTSNNPNTDGFTAFTGTAGSGSTFYWQHPTNTYGALGLSFQNIGSGTVNTVLHPGSTEEPAIARWTSPFTGSITFSGTFGAGDTANLDAYIRVNGQVVWSALDFSTDQSFSLTRSVTSGDRIDFLVTGGYAYGSTPLTVSINAAAPAKNTGSRFWIPTEDEWYKAAYYKGGGTNAGYWLYATQSNTAPDNTIGGSANQANYYAGDYAVTQSSSLLAGQNYLTDVGAFTNSASFYGTFDQSGNVWEWTDLDGAAGSSRSPRGGAWDSHASGLPSSFRTPIDPSLEGNYVGFRLAGALLPESTRTVSGFSNVAVRVGNTAPSLTSSWSVNTPEDTTFSFTAEQFSSRFSDPELDSLASITLTAIPSATAGVLRLDGSTLANSAVLKAGDLARLQFVPAAHFNGNATFSYTASDGYLSSSSSSTVTISVTAANDAPVLDISGSPVATTIAEDVSSANNNGTTVATLVIDGSITDVDVVSPASAPEAMAVTSVDNSNGLWQYKVGSGSWTSFSSTRGVVNLGGAALLLDGSDSVRFVPDANYNGTASFTYRAWDKSSGSAGGTSDPFAAGGNTALSAAEEIASITISAVNDAPTTAGKTISFNEDSSYVFTAGDFAFSDLDAGASFSSITITALPATGKGSITLFNGSSDVAVSANQVISLADITSGKLKYTPPADAFGTSYASIDFTVSDGSASSSAATITFDVADTNDAPTAIVWATGGTVAENSAAHTVVGSLTATDPNAGDVLRFRITNNSNFYVSPNGTVKVVENATIDFEQASTQTITVEVSDSGGLTYSQNLTVTLSDVVESDPSVYATPLYVALNSTTTITTANLRAADAQQTAAQLVFTIISPPTGGTFWIDSDGNGAISGNEKALGFRSESNPSAVNTFTQDDINNGRLKFSKDSSQTSGQLSVEVSDGTGGAKPRATLVLIPSSPPVVSPVADQQWSTSGAQSFRLPANTFSDPDQDELTVSALLVTGPSTTAALPSWLSFNANTWTFSGTPTGQADGSSITLRVSASDGRTTAVSDDFVISFVTTRTAPSVANPIANQVFDGDGTKSFVVPSNTFSDPNNATITYGATLANGSALPSWLSFNAGTRTLSGNPPASAVPGPYWIKVTGTSTGGSAETFFRLDVVNANDNPVESPAGTIPDRTLTADGSFTVNRSAFSDLDGGTLALNATLADGNPLPSWLQYSFDASTGVGIFTTNLPGGSGSATVRVVADDGLGGSGFADFTINYSGGTNAAPQVRTAAGTSTMVTTNTSNGGTALWN